MDYIAQSRNKLRIYCGYYHTDGNGGVKQMEEEAGGNVAYILCKEVRASMFASLMQGNGERVNVESCIGEDTGSADA